MNKVALRYVAKPAAIGVLVGGLVAAPAIMIAMLSGGAGHGDYAAARALFPVPMLLTLLQGDTIGVLSIGLALLQFPIFGALVGWCMAKENYLPAIAIILTHVVAASVCFAGMLPNFS